MNHIELDATVWSDGTISRAWFDESRRYRYMLERDFRNDFLGGRPDLGTGAVTFVMLNPSTADAHKNDPTVARCCSFAKRWGFKRLLVVNLFAFRSTDPNALKWEPQADGDPENMRMILRAAAESELVVCASSNHGALRERAAYVYAELLRLEAVKLRCFGQTQSGQPLHPLYRPAASKFETLAAFR